MKKIIINKNRGWRGLAEVVIQGDEHKEQMRMIFSFSQPVWDDMQEGVMVLQQEDDYHIIRFDRTEDLPKGQRSVLLKNFIANVTDTIVIPKFEWEGRTRGSSYYRYIDHFRKNRNNHTQSDWNCIGVRVVPII
jgi:hypothetical protein